MTCVQMMQEWLALHKLDRKQLAALAGNAQAAQVYEAYLRHTVQEVMEDLLADFDEPEPEPTQGTSQVNLAAVVTCEAVAVFGCCCPMRRSIACQCSCCRLVTLQLLRSCCCF